MTDPDLDKTPDSTDGDLEFTFDPGDLGNEKFSDQAFSKDETDSETAPLTPKDETELLVEVLSEEINLGEDSFSHEGSRPEAVTTESLSREILDLESAVRYLIESDQHPDFNEHVCFAVTPALATIVSENHPEADIGYKQLSCEAYVLENQESEVAFGKLNEIANQVVSELVDMGLPYTAEELHSVIDKSGLFNPDSELRTDILESGITREEIYAQFEQSEEFNKEATYQEVKITDEESLRLFIARDMLTPLVLAAIDEGEMTINGLKGISHGAGHITSAMSAPGESKFLFVDLTTKQFNPELPLVAEKIDRRDLITDYNHSVAFIPKSTSVENHSLGYRVQYQAVLMFDSIHNEKVTPAVQRLADVIREKSKLKNE